MEYNERQYSALAKIESIDRMLDVMLSEGDITHLVRVLLKNDLGSLELQIKNINLPESESEK